MQPKEFATAPTVYAVGRCYQIMVPVTCETVMWVRVGDRIYPHRDRKRRNGIRGTRRGKSHRPLPHALPLYSRTAL